MHGYTHCLPDGKSSGEGYEFWNTEQDSFITNVDFISKRIILGLKQFKKQGILPAAFCPPHYAFPHDGYRILKDYLPVLVGQKQINNTIDMMQDFPFLINEDEQGLTIIPENLGYVTDRKDIDQIINNARRLTVIRDGTASFFYHWFMPPEYLESLVDWFQFNGYQFVDLDNYQKTRPKFNKQLLLNTKDNKLIKPPHYWVKMALEIIAGFCLIIILYALILFCYKKLNQGGD